MNFRILFRIIAFTATVLLLLFFPWEILKPEWFNRILHFSTLFISFSAATELGKHIFIYYYRKRKHLKYTESDNVIEALNNLYYIVLFFAVLTTIFSFFKLNILDVITSLSIVAAAIAIVSKDYLVNIISGLITVFSKELEIGDNIQTGKHKGKVTSITLSSIVLLNDDDDVVYIPNNMVYANDFINYTKRKVRKTNIDFDLNNKFLLPAEDLEKLLFEALKEHVKLIEKNSINLRIEEINNDHINFKYQFSLKQPNRNNEKIIRRNVKRVILNLMAEKSKNFDG